jgi:hypothetical protein
MPFHGEPYPGAFKQSGESDDGPCPHCGYCRHCGRHNAAPVYVPQYPQWVPRPYPTYPWWQQPTTTVAPLTFGGDVAPLTWSAAGGSC